MISLVIGREDAPPKPDPLGLSLILAKWNVRPTDVLFVGDYLYDLEAGQRAGVQTILFCPQTPDFEHGHTQVIKNLLDVQEYL